MTAIFLETPVRVARRWRGQTVAHLDVVLYTTAACFAVLIALLSNQSPQWHWGLLAFGPFVLCAVLSGLGERLSPLAQMRWRWLVLGVAFLGVVVGPLAFEIGSHVSPYQIDYYTDVGVIDQAGYHLMHGKTIYTSYFNSAGQLVNPDPGVPAFESFFPYFPLMAMFGLPAALTGHDLGLSDARVAMTIFTVLALFGALALMRAPPDRKLRTAQFLLVLPTGSLFLATGGDDMPILALCLLALVAAQRHKPVATGLALGIAGAMKLTAWPFAVALLAVSYYNDGRRSWRTVATTLALIVAVVVTPYVLLGPRAFIANVFAFPLGLAGITSPAASPLPGHVLTDMFPVLRHVLMPVVLAVGSFLVFRYLRPRWPIELPTALRVLAVAMAVVIFSATATRIGYVIYPIDFLLWAWVFSPVLTPLVEGVVLEEAQRPGGGVH